MPGGKRAMGLTKPRPRRQLTSPDVEMKTPISPDVEVKTPVSPDVEVNTADNTDPPTIQAPNHPVVEQLAGMLEGLKTGAVASSGVKEVTAVLKKQGADWDLMYKEYMCCVFSELQCLLPAAAVGPVTRAALLDMLELRARHWVDDPQADTYYAKKMRQMRGRQPNHQAPVVRNEEREKVQPRVLQQKDLKSAAVPRKISAKESSPTPAPALSPAAESNVTKDCVPAAGPESPPRIQHSKSFIYLTEEPKREGNHYKYELVIRENSVGKVFGIGGEKLKKIEAGSNTTISISKERGFDRLVTIQGHNAEAIKNAVAALETLSTSLSAAEQFQVGHDNAKTVRRRQESDSSTSSRSSQYSLPSGQPKRPETPTDLPTVVQVSGKLNMSEVADARQPSNTSSKQIERQDSAYPSRTTMQTMMVGDEEITVQTSSSGLLEEIMVLLRNYFQHTGLHDVGDKHDACSQGPTSAKVAPPLPTFPPQTTTTSTIGPGITSKVTPPSPTIKMATSVNSPSPSIQPQMTANRKTPSTIQSQITKGTSPSSTIHTGITSKVTSPSPTFQVTTQVTNPSPSIRPQMIAKGKSPSPTLPPQMTTKRTPPSSTIRPGVASKVSSPSPIIKMSTTVKSPSPSTHPQTAERKSPSPTIQPLMSVKTTPPYASDKPSSPPVGTSRASPVSVKCQVPLQKTVIPVGISKVKEKALDVKTSVTNKIGVTKDDLNWDDLDGEPFVFGKKQFSVSSTAVNLATKAVAVGDEIDIQAEKRDAKPKTKMQLKQRTDNLLIPGEPVQKGNNVQRDTQGYQETDHVTEGNDLSMHRCNIEIDDNHNESPVKGSLTADTVLSCNPSVQHDESANIDSVTPCETGLENDDTWDDESDMLLQELQIASESSDLETNNQSQADSSNLSEKQYSQEAKDIIDHVMRRLPAIRQQMRSTTTKSLPTASNKKTYSQVAQEPLSLKQCTSTPTSKLTTLGRAGRGRADLNVSSIVSSQARNSTVASSRLGDNTDDFSSVFCSQSVDEVLLTPSRTTPGGGDTTNDTNNPSELDRACMLSDCSSLVEEGGQLPDSFRRFRDPCRDDDLASNSDSVSTISDISEVGERRRWGSGLPPHNNVIREPIQPSMAARDLIKAEVMIASRPWARAACQRRKAFARTAVQHDARIKREEFRKALNRRSLEREEVRQKQSACPRSTYTREFLLQQSGADICKVPPSDWSALTTVFPGVCLRQACNFDAETDVRTPNLNSLKMNDRGRGLLGDYDDRDYRPCDESFIDPHARAEYIRGRNLLYDSMEGSTYDKPGIPWGHLRRELGANRAEQKEESGSACIQNPPTDAADNHIVDRKRDAHLDEAFASIRKQSASLFRRSVSMVDIREMSGGFS